MSRGWPRIEARFAFLILLCMPAWPVQAGTTTYVWSSLNGAGYAFTYPGNDYRTFTSESGSVIVHYDPDNLAESSIDVAIGGPGFEVDAYTDFQATDTGGGLTLTATGYEGASATVVLWGATGPINASGLPESLDPLLGTSISVSAQSGYHAADQFVFFGQATAVPEPSPLRNGLVALTVAAGVILTRRR